MGEQGGVSRRDVLKLGGATGGLIATAGCISWPPGGGGNDNDDNDEDGDDEDETTEDGGGGGQNETETNSSEESERENETTDEDTEAGNESNETDEENETEERQKEPSEEDTEIDEEQYNETEAQEVEDRPESDVSVDASVSRGSDNTIIVAGELTNVSDEDIDFVDVEVNYVGETGTTVGMDLVVVRDVAAGATKQFESRMNPTELDGEATEVRFTCYPQDYA